MTFGAYGGFLTPIANLHYIKHNNDEMLTLFSKDPVVAMPNYMKIIRQHFLDYPELIKKVESREIRPSWFYMVIDFYNKNCY